jgi:mycobactin polyketide synthetase MbtD
MMAHRLPDGRIPVLLSAHEADLIGKDAAAIVGYLQRRLDAPGVAGVAATLLRTRRVRRHRAVVRAADQAELVAGLAALADGDEHPLVAQSSATATPRTAFVFPGQGNQWPLMGADAYRQLSAYRAETDRCAQAFTAAGLSSPLEYLVTGADREWSQIDIQSAQFTHAVSLAQVWRSCGVLPDITVGHSLGEVAAAYVAGSVELAVAVAVVAARARVVERLAGPYGMAVLGVGLDDAERLIADTPGWLEVSVVNSPSSTVVSGDRDAVAGIVKLAERDGLFVREIDVAFPAHTSALEALRPMLDELLPAAEFLDTPVEFIGSARGDVVRPGTDFTAYWYDNLRNTVRFDRAATAASLRGVGAFVEMSAHPALVYALTDQIGDALIVGSGKRDEPVVDRLSANIAAAAVANPGYRWIDVVDTARAFSAFNGPTLPGFPNAPMREIHLWATPEPLRDEPAGSSLTIAVEEWESRDSPATRTRCTMAIVAPTDGLGGKSESLARQLTAAIAKHRACDLVPPGEADIVVLIAPAVQDSDLTVAAGKIANSAAPDYASNVGPRCRRAWLITAGAECAGSEQGSEQGSGQQLPAQAALAAMHRSVGFEFPDCRFAHLDLPDWDVDADDALGCVDALLDDSDADVALRAGSSGLRRYVRVLRERAQLPRQLDAGTLDNVVITGGNGAIGMRYARYCVQHGARRIVLLSRTGVDREALNEILSGRDVEVHAPTCDITDPEALSAVAAGYAGDGASLLIHTAGAATFAPRARLSDADLANMLQPKVVGLARMVEVWPVRRDLRILLCSSVSGVWGGHGHAGYSAANRMLDVLAGQLRGEGFDCTAVRWGLWPGTGIGGADEIARIERSGLVAMDPDAAIAASLRHHAGDPLIFAADFERLRVFFESQGARLPFAAPPGAERPPAQANDQACGARTVAEVVRAELAAALRLAGPASVDLSAALIDLGVDSLLALDLRKRLRRDIGRSVPLARLLGGITGAELINALQPAPPVEAPTDTRAKGLESSRD